jgi:hypothetical protein
MDRVRVRPSSGNRTATDGCPDPLHLPRPATLKRKPHRPRTVRLVVVGRGEVASPASWPPRTPKAASLVSSATRIARGGERGPNPRNPLPSAPRAYRLTVAA